MDILQKGEMKMDNKIPEKIKLNYVNIELTVDEADMIVNIIKKTDPMIIYTGSLLNKICSQVNKQINIKDEKIKVEV